MKKYELTAEFIEQWGKKLFRIKALISFGSVEAGELGGYVEKEDNLAQDGDAWVCDDAKVYGDARVYGDAWVYGDAKVYGDARVCGNARVCDDADCLLIGRIGSRFSFTTFFKNKDKGITVSCGCFLGTIAEFRAKVTDTHGNNKHAKMYNLAADMAELQILGEEFMLTNENGRHIHTDKIFFFIGDPTSTRDILISKDEDEEKFCPNILLGLLTGLYCVKKKPWQPEIGDVYFYVAVDEGKNKGVIRNETLFNKNDIKFLLLKKAGKYYKSYFEAEKYLKQDYEYLTGE